MSCRVKQELEENGGEISDEEFREDDDNNDDGEGEVVTFQCPNRNNGCDFETEHKRNVDRHVKLNCKAVPRKPKNQKN